MFDLPVFTGEVGVIDVAGARAFTFIALLAWREPVLGGVGLALLGLLGWLGSQLKRSKDRSTAAETPHPPSTPFTCDNTQRRNCTNAGRISSRSGQ